MGLDMYLERHLWIDGETRVSINGKRQKGVKTVVYEEAYWRKANAIHAWFVDNVQEGKDECRPHLVEVKQLKKLLAIAKRVQKSPELGRELLPTRGGFFFGGTDYRQDYMADIDLTVKQLTAVLGKKTDDGSWFVYRSSW